MQLQFNAYDFDPSQGGSICFPLADYRIEITGAEPKVVKDNPSAGYLELALTVTDGDLRGMVQKDRLNIFHTSEVAKQIAHRQLAAYAFAINRPFVQDTNDLLGGRCIVTIGPQTDDSKYSEVKVVKCMDGSMPTRQQAPGQAQAAAPPPAAPPAQAPAAQGYAQSAPAAPPWASQGAPAPPPMTAATAAPGGPPPPPWANSGAAPQQPIPPQGSMPPWAK
jgi:hypothetical protein